MDTSNGNHTRLFFKVLWILFPLIPNNPIWGEPNLFVGNTFEWLCSRELITYNFSKISGLYFKALFFFGIFSIFSGLLSFSFSYLCMCLRRIFLIFLWSFFYTLNIILLIPHHIIIMVILAIAFLIGGNTIFALTAEGYDWLSSAIYTIIGILIIGILIFCFLFVTQTLLKAFAPILQVASDIFLYIYGYLNVPTLNTNNTIVYQQKLQEKFKTQFNKINPKGKIIFASHSLGTLVALDFFKTISNKNKDSDIVFITMASPINRLILRFFPNIIDFEHLKSFTNFKWINIYRPFDPIGTKLNFNFVAGIFNINTGQINRIAKAHSDYWGDKLILGIILEKLFVLNPIKVFSTKIKSYPLPLFFNSLFFTQTRFFVSLVLSISFSILYVINQLNYTIEWTIANRNNHLNNSGIKVNGTLTAKVRPVARYPYTIGRYSRIEEERELNIFFIFNLPADTNIVFVSRVLVYQIYDNKMIGGNWLVDNERLRNDFIEGKSVSGSVDTSFFNWIINIPKKFEKDIMGNRLFKVNNLNLLKTWYMEVSGKKGRCCMNPMAISIPCYLLP